MELDQLRRALRGVLAFAPTPFDDDNRVGFDALARQVDLLAGSGVCGVVVGGGVGEFYALDADEHRRCVEVAVEAAAGRVPVLAGIGHATDIACGLAARSATAGAAGLMVNPFYFVRPEPAGVAAHYRAIAAASGLGLMVFSTRDLLYDAPALDALSEVEPVIAVKDEFGDTEVFAECVRQLGDRYVWVNGMAEPPALDYARLGATVMTSGVANLEPALAIAVWDAALAGDAAEHARLMDRVGPIQRMRASRPGYSTTVIKAAMALLGRGPERVRLPLVGLRDEERQALHDHLASAGFLV